MDHTTAIAFHHHFPPPLQWRCWETKQLKTVSRQDNMKVTVGSWGFQHSWKGSSQTLQPSNRSTAVWISRAAWMEHYEFQPRWEHQVRPATTQSRALVTTQPRDSKLHQKPENYPDRLGHRWHWNSFPKKKYCVANNMCPVWFNSAPPELNSKSHLTTELLFPNLNPPCQLEHSSSHAIQHTALQLLACFPISFPPVSLIFCCFKLQLLWR